MAYDPIVQEDPQGAHVSGRRTARQLPGDATGRQAQEAKLKLQGHPRDPGGSGLARNSGLIHCLLSILYSSGAFI